MENVEDVYVFDFLRQKEILNDSHGDSVTLRALLMELKNKYKNVYYTSYRDIGILGKLIDLSWGLKRGNKTALNNNTVRWLNTAFLYILIDIFGKFTFFVNNSLGLKKEKRPFDVIIGRPYFFSYIYKFIKHKNGIGFSLLEHNIEKTFFEFQLERKIIISQIVSNRISKIEAKALKNSSLIYTVSVKDENALKKEFSAIKVKKINYKILNKNLPPLFFLLTYETIKFSNTILGRLENNTNYLKIGFIGSNYSLNVISVERIIDIAKCLLNEKVYFMIIGEVSSSFKNRNDIPSNVFFRGFVQDVYYELSKCDIYILFDLMPTGLETKSLLYDRLEKLVIISGQSLENYYDLLGEKTIYISNKKEIVSFLHKYCKLRKVSNFTVIRKGGL